ncbi:MULTISPECIES: AbrB/MazE/SpoVT family DNA-binding domain-containing protein [Priestia]|uniref:Transition state regulator Abh n=2 Tax=Priestia aryabhattai TaxID=412384 RepID=A0ABD5KUP0_PRIAR|nr:MULTISPECIES: transition state regulator Abh [Priestia]MBK0294030.1 transition state regulator Abh [Bacillus sp. S34]UPK51395.1 transition state regulator Abh [Bacillus sp. H8-1]AWD63666.1 transition state regulator Abh [Priestia megaterium]MBY0209977.1 transition state regulator Abh [Priestia aryabhattai]MDC7765650.1 transition state regulator Abh [Priestia aryabhattai]
MRTKKEECIIDEMGRVSLPSLFMQLTKLETNDKVLLRSCDDWIIIDHHDENVPVPSHIFIRTIDHMGRIVIPRSLRDDYELKPFDYVELYVVEQQIVMKKRDEKTIALSKKPGAPPPYYATLTGRQIQLTSELLTSVELDANMEVQFFINKENNIVIQKYEMNFGEKTTLIFTAQSRKIDERFRLTIPKKLRDDFSIHSGTMLKIKTGNKQLILEKVEHEKEISSALSQQIDAAIVEKLPK